MTDTIITTTTKGTTDGITDVTSNNKRKKEKKKHKKQKKKRRRSCSENASSITQMLKKFAKESKTTTTTKESPNPTDTPPAKNDERNIFNPEQDENEASVSIRSKNELDNKSKKTTFIENDEKTTSSNPSDQEARIVASSALEFSDQPTTSSQTTTTTTNNNTTLLLFYQYIEPPWTRQQYQSIFQFVKQSAEHHSITGRMRVAREGLNCTLTGTYTTIRNWIRDLRSHSPHRFSQTEFKCTDHLPNGQTFPKLNVFEVEELVHYGLGGNKAPAIERTGVHLEPKEYHAKMMEEDAVIIDVRNHYESAIGHFRPPSNGANWIDPKMRKSTEFPAWLDKPETRQQLQNKQVLMYCTGGVRCERASALLRQKMETCEDVKRLGIRGVYQLQGGIDKYFKEYPRGGWWTGKNYVFDKRFEHAPPKAESNDIMANCEACGRPWDRYRKKKRCVTCGVPILICKACFDVPPPAKKNVKSPDGRNVRCHLCVEENITSKAQLKERESKQWKEGDTTSKQKQRTTHHPPNNPEIPNATKPFECEPQSTYSSIPNPENITRLFIKNMHNRRMDEATLCQTLDGITHIQWIIDRNTGKFYGSAFVEMATPRDASRAVAKDGLKVFGRPMKIKYQKADPKDVWPLPNTAVGLNS